MDSPSTSHQRQDIRSNQKAAIDDNDDIIYAFKRYVHVKKDRKQRQTRWNYELNEIDNRDVRGNENLHAVSEEIRAAAARDRNRRRTRGGAVTYSDPLVTQLDGRSTINQTRKEDMYRSREPQKGVYDHPFYRDREPRPVRSASETNLHESRTKDSEESGAMEKRKSLRPTTTKGHQPTELPTASLAGQSLSKYKKDRRKSAKGERTANTSSKKDDTGFMLSGAAYANSL